MIVTKLSGEKKNVWEYSRMQDFFVFRQISWIRPPISKLPLSLRWQRRLCYDCPSVERQHLFPWGAIRRVQGGALRRRWRVRQRLPRSHRLPSGRSGHEARFICPAQIIGHFRANLDLALLFDCRYCGTFAGIRQLDMRSGAKRFVFHSNGENNDVGYSIYVKQIECDRTTTTTERPTVPGRSPIPPLSTYRPPFVSTTIR